MLGDQPSSSGTSWRCMVPFSSAIHVPLPPAVSGSLPTVAPLASAAPWLLRAPLLGLPVVLCLPLLLAPAC